MDAEYILKETGLTGKDLPYGVLEGLTIIREKLDYLFESDRDFIIWVGKVGYDALLPLASLVAEQRFRIEDLRSDLDSVVGRYASKPVPSEILS